MLPPPTAASAAAGSLARACDRTGERASARALGAAPAARPARASDRVREGPEGVGVEGALERALAAGRRGGPQAGGDLAPDRKPLGDRIPGARQQTELARDLLLVGGLVASLHLHDVRREVVALLGAAHGARDLDPPLVLDVRGRVRE